MQIGKISLLSFSKSVSSSESGYDYLPQEGKRDVALSVLKPSLNPYFLKLFGSNLYN